MTHPSPRSARRRASSLSRRRTFDALESRQLLATIVVTGTSDTVAADGVVSLREAIQSVNGGAPVNADVVPNGTFGTNDRIEFTIPGSGVQTITLGSALPTITAPVTIDGYTQPGASANTLAVGDNAVLLIELNANAKANGLVVDPTGAGSTIRGLVVNRAGGEGILLLSDNNVVAGNFIGTDAAGNAQLGNGGGGVRVSSGAGNLIGGTTPADRNVISGNGFSFGNVVVGGVGAPTGTLIRGNYIGTNAAGTAAIHTQAFQNVSGILVIAGTNTTIGGADADDGATDGNVGARNLISGNASGILTNGNPNGITIQGNFIGVDATGLTALGNFGDGITTTSGTFAGGGNDNIVIGGTAAGAGNVISGNVGEGIQFGALHMTIQGNRVGTDLAGTLDLGNGNQGIHVALGGSGNNPFVIIVGGATAEARNIVSGNGGNGVFVTGLTSGSVTVQGNFIGTQSDGHTALPNDGNGVDGNRPYLLGGTGAGEGNVIAYSGAAGVQSGQIGTSILGNSIFSNTFRGIIFNAGPNPPVLTSVSATTIAGTLTSTANTTYRIELFATPDTGQNADVGRQGKTFLGFVNVTTDGAGNANFTLDPIGGVPAGQLITATATDDPTDTTSEFSAPFHSPVVGVSNLSIQMTDSPDPVGAGGNITYTIVVTNNGSGAATSVLGSNVLPTNTTFVSLDVPTGWTGGPNSQNPQQIQFGTQSLASGATATLMLVVHVDNATPGGTIITNTASVGAQTDPDQHSATTTTTVGAVTANSDLGVTISDTPDPIVAGQNITYTIVVTNSGPDAAANALLNAAVPTNTTFVSFTAPAGWTPSAPAVGGTGPVQATNPSVANGSTSTFTLVVRVNDANSAGSVITANANIGSDTSDTVANNNGATTSTTIAETPPVGETPPTVTSVARFGFHMQPTTLVVTFSTNLDAATATNASNFTLLSPGRDGRFGTHDDRVIRLREVRYDPDSLAVLLSPARRLPLRKTFRLIVRDGVTDSTGNRLDGDADGNAGGQFVAQIDRSLLAGPASALAARVAAHQATPTARVAQIVNKRPAKRR